MTCGALVPQPWNYSACWDTASYQQIAANGYTYTPDQPSTIAFFPMYALLMRWANDLIPGVWILIDTTLVALFLVAGVYLWLRVRASYGALVIAPSLLFGLSGNPQSLNRYLLVLFPVYILLARIRSEAIRIAIIIVFGLGLGIEAFFFMNEMWAG